MKNSVKISEGTHLLLVFSFLILCSSVTGQDNPKTSAPLPDNINKIVQASCMPCHSSNGGMLSKAKLNFSAWTEYSADKQKKKAAQMYKELKKDAMPPKEARETNPDIIPTKEQVEIIKAWADSF
jgi:hypothetical protein